MECATPSRRRVGWTIASLVVGVAIVVTGSPSLDAARKPANPAAGRIDNLETVADLLTYNQDKKPGLAIPGEGRIQRSTGVIARWELPIPVYIDASIRRANVTDAVAFWEAATGLTFSILEKDSTPGLRVRAASSTELNIAIGLGLVYRTRRNNQAERGVVKIRTDYAKCETCANLFRHELGHAIGIFGHMAGGAIMAAPQVGSDASPREINMLVQLYRLPHGTRIEPDGTWRVVR